MEDKEVGRLWRDALEDDDYGTGWQSESVIIPLVRKLVEERSQLNVERFSFRDPKQFLELALRDFGIDPKDWKDE